MSIVKSKDLEHTAHHEAGHVVIGRVLGLPCGSATIIPDEDSSGHAITHDPWKALHIWWEEQGKFGRDFDTAIRLERLPCIWTVTARAVSILRE